jgi:hypothetical protein
MHAGGSSGHDQVPSPAHMFNFASSLFLPMQGIFAEDCGPRRSFILDETPGEACCGQGQQILRLYETDIRT